MCTYISPISPLCLPYISQAVGWVHLSGTMHDAVAAQPERFLHPSPALAGLLDDARTAAG